MTVDRKVLSDLAIREPAAFQAIVEKAKAALPAGGLIRSVVPAHELDARHRSRRHRTSDARG